MSDDIAGNIQEVRERIERAAARAGRRGSDVRLMGVTKTVEPARVRRAVEAGLTLFGENYVQEALDKIDALGPGIEWHMIGHLQSNKAKRVVESFSMLQTLDRPSLGKALDKAAAARGVKLDVLLQVNLGEEATKSGTTADRVEELARQAAGWPSLAIKGLMALPPYLPDPEAVRPYFRQLGALAGRLEALGLAHVQMDELSMGMSHDFEVAVEEGATIVRVGSAIFGERG